MASEGVESPSPSVARSLYDLDHSFMTPRTWLRYGAELSKYLAFSASHLDIAFPVSKERAKVYQAHMVANGEGVNNISEFWWAMGTYQRLNPRLQDDRFSSSAGQKEALEVARRLISPKKLAEFVGVRRFTQEQFLQLFEDSPESVRVLRNQADWIIMWFAMARTSETAGIHGLLCKNVLGLPEHMSEDDDVTVTLVFLNRKNDQHAAARHSVKISNLCDSGFRPVFALWKYAKMAKLDMSSSQRFIQAVVGKEATGAAYTALRPIRSRLEALGYSKEEASQYGTHSFRKGSASHLYKVNGGDIREVMSIGGWFCEATCRIYITPDPNENVSHLI